KIATVPAAGILSSHGQPVVVGQLIPTGDVVAHQLNYIPPTNANGAPLTFFTSPISGSAKEPLKLTTLPSSPLTFTGRLTLNERPHEDNHNGCHEQKVVRAESEHRW